MNFDETNFQVEKNEQEVFMKRRMKRNIGREITHLIIHCSATHADRPFTVEQLEAAHRARGFECIGYHYYILRDGTTVNTRAIGRPGAHCKGYNAHSIGICYEGGLDVEGCPADTRTPEQRIALRLLVWQLLGIVGRNVRICGHRDLSPDLDGDGTVEPEEWTKLCPCFDVARDL